VTIHARVAAARLRLRAAGVSQAESDLDARLLAQHVLGWTMERFLADAQDAEPDGFGPRYDTLVERRAAREPLAYIVGTREFWGLDFEVSRAVLIPRPSTELIVETVLRRFPDRAAALAMADVCTGCGCLAVALALERPSARIVATDISADAIAVAARNTARHGVADRIDLRRADMLDGIGGPLDAVVANPPYVVDGAAPALQPEVRDHEPALALFGGADGLRIIRRLVAEAPARLRPGGLVIFEFGCGQDADVERLLAAAPALALVEIGRDLDGIARTAVAQRR
jgi:release factor glutamine methyltransferase